MNKIVCDASPLIYLSKINQIGILKKLFKTVYIPEMVAHEVTEQISNKLFRAATAWQRIRIKEGIREGWIVVVPTNQLPTAAFNNVPVALDAGEREAIALARTLRATLMIVDENRTIRFLNSNDFPPLPQDIDRYGIRVLNTLGVIHLARKLGVINNMRAVLKEMIVVTRIGFRQDEVIRYLRQHGEWDDKADTWALFTALGPTEEDKRKRANRFI